MRILGAGMAGLLAASMLRRMKPVVCEAQPTLPNNHAALLRFRTDACSKAANIPFRQVQVEKALVWNGELRSTGDIKLNNLYSRKVAGAISNRSILNLSGGTRYIAPDNFIEMLAASAQIEFGRPFGTKQLMERTPESEPLISTIPLPYIMELTGWDPEGFESRPIWALNVRVQSCNVFQTIYYPAPGLPYYRASITGDRLTLEYLAEPGCPEADAAVVAADFGILSEHLLGKPILKFQRHGKIVPAKDDRKRRGFITMLTEKYRIYSLGRFATWRPLLLDDLVSDIQMIERMIESRDGYEQRKVEARQ